MGQHWADYRNKESYRRTQGLFEQIQCVSHLAATKVLTVDHVAQVAFMLIDPQVPHASPIITIIVYAWSLLRPSRCRVQDWLSSSELDGYGFEHDFELFHLWI